MFQGRRRCSHLLKFLTSKHVLSELFSVGYPGGNHPSSVEKTIEFIGIKSKIAFTSLGYHKLKTEREV